MAKAAGSVRAKATPTSLSFLHSLFLDLLKVSDDKIGQMRLRFWTDAIEKIYEKNRSKRLPEHPAILELNNVSCVAKEGTEILEIKAK